jgi:acetyl-CoA C-acetyltransferase
VNIGRVAALRMGCGIKVQGWTVMRNCASGMQAIDSAMANIHSGRSQLVLAGGVDALSRAPLLLSDPMVRWFAGWMGAQPGQRLAMLKKFRFGYLAPVIGIMKGLTDPIVGQLMGQTAENLAWRFGISRDEMDAFAVESHRRVAAAQDAGHFAEIVPLIDRDGSVYAATTACAGTPRWPASPSSSPSSTRNTAASPRQQLADHRRRGLAGAGLGSGGGAARPHADRPHRRQPVGGLARAWASARCMRPRPSCSATAWAERPRPVGAQRSLRRPGDRLPARLAGRRLLPRAPGLPGALGNRPARLNVDGGAVALGHPVGASGAHRAASAAGLRRTGGSGASPPSASVAVWVAQCWWRPCDGTATLETRTRRRRHRLGHAGRGGQQHQHPGQRGDAELAGLLDELDRQPPTGLVIRSGKAAGFIAGADIEEFTRIDSPPPPARWWSAAGACSTGWRRWPTRPSRWCAATAWAAASSWRWPAATASPWTSPPPAWRCPR